MLDLESGLGKAPVEGHIVLECLHGIVAYSTASIRHYLDVTRHQHRHCTVLLAWMLHTEFGSLESSTFAFDLVGHLGVARLLDRVSVDHG